MSRGYCDLCGAQIHGQTHTCNPASALLSPPVSDPKAYARLAARLAEAVGLLREGEDFHWDDGPDDAHDSYAARVRRFLEDGEGS